MFKQNKNVLFLVTGMTPAIITETIWALACDPTLAEDEVWIPDEVHVLSTEHGLNQIRLKLIDDGVIEQFKSDYPQLAKTQFNESFMHCIKDTHGELINDLKTPAENEFAADAINEYIRELTQQEELSLHVSIAGGRKTMGFYAGYALSIHGRAQDRMSHVLVEQKFENAPDFFYPTPDTHFVVDRNGEALDCFKAQIWLAEIPFVRMKDAIRDRHQLKTDSFSDTVSKINEASNDISIKINVKEKKIIINDKFEIDDLPPKEFSFFCLFADDRAKGNVGIATPKINLNAEGVVPSQIDSRYIANISARFMEFYSQLRDESYLDDKEIDVGKSYFQLTKSDLKKELELKLGLELAAKLEITNHKRSGKPFFLNVAPDAIQFI